MTLRFVENPAYDLGNARSIWAGRAAMADGGFVLVMGDHVVEPAVVAAVAPQVAVCGSNHVTAYWPSCNPLIVSVCHGKAVGA